MTRKSYFAQRIANAFPLWSNIRSDEQSLGRQLLNPIGNNMDDMLMQLQKIGDNYCLPTSVISDIDVYYYVKLPGDFVFEKLDNDHTEWIYTPPTVSGYVGTTGYEISISDKNDVESFWYTSSPDRISLGTTMSGIEAQWLIASGIAINSPIPILLQSGIIGTPNRLLVTMSGGGAYIYRDESNTVYTTTVQIDGQTRAGAEISEEMYFIMPETLRTQHEFQNVTEIRTYCTTQNTDATIKVNTASFQMPYKLVAYPELAVNQYGEATPFFWNLSSGIYSGQTTIDLCKYDVDDPRAQMAGFIDRSPYVQFAAYDTLGNNIHALDLVPEFYSNRLWVVDSGKLYLYDTDLHMPDMSSMPARTYDAMAIIEPTSYWIAPHEAVGLFYVWKRPISSIQKYRITVIYPDGTKYQLSNGVLTVYAGGTDSWEDAPYMIDRNIQKYDELTLTTPGDYLFSLEVGYVDGTSSIDQRIVSVLTKTAKAQWNLTDIIPLSHGTIFNGIDIDSENKLWVHDNAGLKYQINLHYDNMIIDFNRKIIYLREPYDQVRVYDY